MTLTRAIEIAYDAHNGMTDKAGKRYIEHPLRVMHKFAHTTECIVAVLHDVVEDSTWTLEHLRKEGFSDEVTVALDHLTRRDGESYMDFIQRCKGNEMARMVKVADLEDNMDMSRIPRPKKSDYRRHEKYKKALAYINS